MKIHIVDSVKGGSGKSTFSLKLCCALKSQKDTNPCIIDLDLLGTSWKHIYEKCLEYSNYKKGKSLIYLNDLVKDFEYYKNTQFIQKINIISKLNASSDKEHLVINAVFCDPNPNAKKLYRITDNEYIPDISYDVFHDEFMALLNYLNEEGYTDVILDMPPNSDPYSDKVLHTCLKVNWHLNFIQSTSLYMVSSINLAHIKSTFDWYSDFMDRAPQRIATQNNFSKIKNGVAQKDDSEEKKKIFESEKSDWFKSERFKFFLVFNEINQPSSYSLENLFLSSKNYSIANQLVYYKVAFDNLYAESMYGILGFPVTIDFVPNTISINSLDIHKYMFYEEIVSK